MSTVPGATPPQYFGSSHESNTNAIEEELAEAYARLGLPNNARVKDDTIIDIFQARADDDPVQKEELVPSLRTIAQHRDQGGPLNDFLEVLSIAVYHTALDTLGLRSAAHDSTIIVLYEFSSYPNQEQKDRAYKALKTIADHRDSHQLKAFVSAEFQENLSRSATHTAEPTSGSSDDGDAIVVNGIRYVKADWQTAVDPPASILGSIDARPSTPSQPDTSGRFVHSDTFQDSVPENACDDTDLAGTGDIDDPLPDFELGTIDKPQPTYGYVIHGTWLNRD